MGSFFQYDLWLLFCHSDYNFLLCANFEANNLLCVNSEAIRLLRVNSEATKLLRVNPEAIKLIRQQKLGEPPISLQFIFTVCVSIQLLVRKFYNLLMLQRTKLQKTVVGS